MEKSKRSLTVRMKHEDDYGVNEDPNLGPSVRASNKEDSQRTTTLTDNKKERLRKRRIFHARRLMHWHQLRSHVPKCFRSLHTLLGCVLYFVSSIQLLSLYPLTQFLTCTRIPCRVSHCAADRRQL